MLTRDRELVKEPSLNDKDVPPWKRAMLQCAAQHPLLQTHESLSGMASLQKKPAAVTLGIGLSSRRTLSMGLPFDVLGMLLPAEQLRRATGAERIVALVADRHALSNGFCNREVDQRATEVVSRLCSVRDALGLPLEVVRAEALHRSREHLRAHAAVRAVAASEHAYVTLELADTETLRRRYGAIVKLGWAFREGSNLGGELVDERFFDSRFREWVGSDVGFAYAKPGRTLDPKRPTAAPYIAVDPARRLLLSANESIEAKLSRFAEHASHTSRSAVLSHLRRITWAYSRTFSPLHGDIAGRVRGVIDHIFAAPTVGARAQGRASAVCSDAQGRASAVRSNAQGRASTVRSRAQGRASTAPRGAA